jgi:hypothetical protein
MRFFMLHPYRRCRSACLNYAASAALHPILSLLMLPVNAVTRPSLDQRLCRLPVNTLSH